MHLKKTKSRPQHKNNNCQKTKKVIVTVVWNLIPPNISCCASFFIYRIATKYTFQFCDLSLYQEIGKKIKHLEKKSNKHRKLEQNYTVKYQNQLISDMGDRIYMNYNLFFYGARISRVGFAD